jgi:hypothetical protein
VLVLEGTNKQVSVRTIMNLQVIQKQRTTRITDACGCACAHACGAGGGRLRGASASMAICACIKTKLEIHDA